MIGSTIALTICTVGDRDASRGTSLTRVSLASLCASMQARTSPCPRRYFSAAGQAIR
jgi:hypothetical protein